MRCSFAALNSMVKNFSIEWTKDKVPVSLVIPGLISSGPMSKYSVAEAPFVGVVRVFKIVETLGMESTGKIIDFTNTILDF